MVERAGLVAKLGIKVHACSAMPAGMRRPTLATTRGRYEPISAIGILRTRRATPPSRRIGSRGFGGISQSDPNRGGAQCCNTRSDDGMSATKVVPQFVVEGANFGGLIRFSGR